MTLLKIEQLADDNTDLGYWLDSPESAVLARHHQLWVWLRPRPTERHYDPERVECRVVLPAGHLDRIAIRHPWTRSERYRFCVGGVNLEDRKHRRVHFYSFGGELTITATGNATLCRFSSEAPILALDEQNPLTGIFIDEVEAEWAAVRAAWVVEHRPGSFEGHLCQVAPLALYRACLSTVAEHLRLLHGDIATPVHQLVHFAEHELTDLARTSGVGNAASLMDLLLIEGAS